MIDHIGTKRIVLRRSKDGISMRVIRAEQNLELDTEEWADLVGLVVAIKAAVEYTYLEQS